MRIRELPNIEPKLPKHLTNQRLPLFNRGRRNEQAEMQILFQFLKQGGPCQDEFSNDGSRIASMC